MDAQIKMYKNFLFHDKIKVEFLNVFKLNLRSKVLNTSDYDNLNDHTFLEAILKQIEISQFCKIKENIKLCRFLIYYKI